MLQSEYIYIFLKMAKSDLSSVFGVAAGQLGGGAGDCGCSD